MTPQDLAFLKTSVALFADFTDAQREELANGSRVVVYAPGEAIVQAGDEVHFLGVILEGEVTASVPTPDGGQQLLGRLSPGGTFGEMALMTGDPMVADLVAETRARVMLLPLTLFQSHIMAEPRAVQQISRTIG